MENGKYVTNFEVSDYFKKTYGFAPGVRTTADIPGDLAYNGFVVAVKNAAGDGQMKSNLVRDAGLPFEKTMASVIINDPKVKISEEYCIGSHDQSVVHFIVVCKNPESSVFKPTATCAVSDCFNVGTDYEAELLFLLDDEYLVPIRKKVKTHGPGPYRLVDVISDLHEALFDHDAEALEEFFENCDGVQMSEEDDEVVMTFMASTADGMVKDFHYPLDSENIGELARSLVSVRLISCKQTIDTK